MCLNVSSGPHITKEAFYTVKLVEDVHGDRFSSFFREAAQHIGQTLATIIDSPYKGKIQNAIHSYHSVPNTDYAFDCVITRAVVLYRIDPGAIFYVGKYGDIASSKLYIEEFLVKNRSCNIKLEEASY